MLFQRGKLSFCETKKDTEVMGITMVKLYLRKLVVLLINIDELIFGVYIC